MKRLAQIACTFIVLCGCCDKAREAHDEYLRCLEARLGHINLRTERNDYRHDIELREIRRHSGITNDLTFVAENGGGGPSPEYAQLAARLNGLEEWQREIDQDVNAIKMTDYGLLLEMIGDVSRALDRTCHHQDALSDRLDRLEQRLASTTQDIASIQRALDRLTAPAATTIVAVITVTP